MVPGPDQQVGQLSSYLGCQPVMDANTSLA